MVAFDRAQHRLYVVCGQPGMVILMNSDSGSVVGTQPARLRADGMQYDSDSQRLYVPDGEGYMGIYDTGGPDHFKLVEDRLFLAVSPGESKAMAKVLTYEVK